MNVFPPAPDKVFVGGAQPVNKRIHSVCQILTSEKRRKDKQTYAIKLSVKLGDTQVKTIEMIQQAFGGDSVGMTKIKEWYNLFKSGRTVVEGSN